MAPNRKIRSDAWPFFRLLFAMAVGLFALTAFQAAPAAGVYRWLDEHGKVHYGDRPPSGVESSRIETEPAPAPAPEDGERRMKTRRLLDALESERDREKQKAAQAEAERAQREGNCQRARRQAANFRRASGIFRRGSDGERIYLSDEEREQALARTLELVDQWCN